MTSPHQITYEDISKLITPQDFTNTQPFIAYKVHGQVVFTLFRNMSITCSSTWLSGSTFPFLNASPGKSTNI